MNDWYSMAGCNVCAAGDVGPALSLGPAAGAGVAVGDDAP
jgi:hypothetical protein